MMSTTGLSSKDEDCRIHKPLDGAHRAHCCSRITFVACCIWRYQDLVDQLPAGGCDVWYGTDSQPSGFQDCLLTAQGYHHRMRCPIQHHAAPGMDVGQNLPLASRAGRGSGPRRLLSGRHCEQRHYISGRRRSRLECRYDRHIYPTCSSHDAIPHLVASRHDR